MPSGDKTPIRVPFPCPICGNQTRIWGGRHTANGLQYRYRDCQCGARFTTVQNGRGEQFHTELKRASQDDEAIEADPMEARLTLKQMRRLIVLSLVADYQLCKATTGRFEIDPEDAPVLARMAKRKAA